MNTTLQKKQTQFKFQIMTCPRDAAATGSGEISENSSSIDNPSSCSIVLKAMSVENGVIRSCNSESSSKYDGGIKSYKKDKGIMNLNET